MLTAAEVIALLDLQPHPEGGRFRETFRDPRTILQGHEDIGAASGLADLRLFGSLGAEFMIGRREFEEADTFFFSRK
jgi:hypothetical protein